MIIKPQRFLCDSLLTSAERISDKVALVIEGDSYTYSQLLEAASNLATGLLDRGLQRGDRVAIYMDNTWPCIVSLYAITLAGGVFLIINPQTKADKLSFIITDCGARILLSDAHLSEQLNAVLPELGLLEHVICSGNLEKQAINDMNISGVVEIFAQVLSVSQTSSNNKNITPSDLAALIYTSGSTGNPKGVMHNHSSMTFALGSLIEYLRLSESDIILNVLPFAFDYGLYQLLMSVHLGATLVLERSFTYPALVFKRIEEFQVTVFPAVPTIFSMLLAAHKRKKIVFNSITRVTNTAAALPAEYISNLKEIFPNALIYKMYGLTECKRVCYLEPELLDDNGRSVGKAIPGTEIYLLGADGHPVDDGEMGILYVRGPHIMLGYWNNPEQTEKMLKSGELPGERVLCTHDWFKKDANDLLYFIGRSDDIIKTRGEKVSPIEVENVLLGIDGITEAAVIGLPDEMLGESVNAYISLENDSSLIEREIRKICMSRLENFMVPQKIYILDELPKTSTGKITKKDLGK